MQVEHRSDRPSIFIDSWQGHVGHGIFNDFTLAFLSSDDDADVESAAINLWMDRFDLLVYKCNLNKQDQKSWKIKMKEHFIWQKLTG